MAQKSKKPKTPKTKGGGTAGKGSGQDPVNGIYMEFYLDNPNQKARFESDRTYSPEEVSRIESSIGLPSDALRIQREFELDERFIVQTNLTTYEYGNWAVERHVFSGAFKFTKGKLSSATIFSSADEIINFQDGSIQARGGFIGNISKGQGVATPTSYKAWSDLLFSQNLVPQAGYNYDALLGRFYEGSTSDAYAMARFGEGRFFNDGWWQDPFTPNLI